MSAVPFFGDLLALSRLVRDRGAGFGWKLLAIATFAYVISPVDFFPEAVAPVIAWVDDVGLVLAVRLLLDQRLARYRYPLFGAAPPTGFEDDAEQIRVREVRSATTP
jgi:uncharacterized membrane protein YkvA (DUF1232 family)